MPIDFRTYADPGVYIETITPPVVFTAAIEPTIVAIVGDAQEVRTVYESDNFYTGGVWTDLVALGGNPSTLKVKGKFPLEGIPYVSAALGTLTADIASGDTALAFTLFDANWIEPSATTFVAQIEDEKVTITTANGTIANGVYTVTSGGVARGASATSAVAHLKGQVVNDTEAYATTNSLEVGSIYGAGVSGTFTATNNAVDVLGLNGVQTVTLTGLSGSDNFTLHYNGVDTATITNAVNYTQAGIKTALEAILGGGANVKVLKIDGADTTLTTAGFIVKFYTPNTDVLPLTVTNLSGVTAVVAPRGVLSGTYLDVEGERLIVTAVSATGTPNVQTVTVARAAAGTTAASHSVGIKLYENSGEDYLVKVGAGTDLDLQTGDDSTSVTVLSRIGNGDLMAVQMDVTDAEQFSVGMFDDLDTIRDKYGDPLDANGNVYSELTLAAQLAMANGATQLILCAADSTDAEPIQSAVAKLQFEQVCNSVVILSGDAADISYVKTHVEQMSDQGLLRRAFVGLDGTQNPVPTSSDFINKAAQLNSERVSLVAPSQMKLDSSSGTPVIIPGYFGAAAVAGLQANYGPAVPLTRKQVFGFVGLNDQDTNQNTFSMQASGVLVLYEDRFSRIIIKHGLTTDMSSVYTREISIITARDRLRDFIMDTLDSGELIGSPIDASTPTLVLSAIQSALEEAVSQGLIFDYANTVYRYPTENPTMIQVRFSYKPTLSLNYILVQFSIDTTVGTTDFQSINDNTDAQG